MPVRRASDPSNVQHIWNAIRCANAQRQVSDLPRILKFIQKVGNCSQLQAELYVKQTVDDGLVVAVQKTGYKGSKTGVPIESYRIPIQELTTPHDDGKDWYCIECHLAGDVTPCKLCHRVFHAECSTNARRKQIVFPSIRHSSSSSQNVQNITDSESNEKTIANSSTRKIDEFEKQLRNLENASNNVNSTSSTNGTNLSKAEDDLHSSKEIINISDDECGIRKSFDHDYIYDESICSICNFFKIDDGCGLDKKELNHLLCFILDRIRSWLPAILTHTMTNEQPYDWLTESELSWRSAQLFYQHMDMNVMELKLQAEEYTKLCEFQGDVITIQHNVAIFHGIESQEYGAAELMLRDCCHDLSELKICVDCYRHSNEKVNSKWFCLPCRNPHKLVWAKQKGYPYWPAKVIKESSSNYDVRFFGGKYERSVLPKNCIRPITTSMQTLQIKRSSALNRSIEELRLHQKLLENPNELSKLLALSKPRKPVSSKTKEQIDNIQNTFENHEENIKKLLGSSKDCDFNESSNSNENIKDSECKGAKRKSTSLASSSSSTPNSKSKKRVSNTIVRSSSTEKQDVIPISDAEEDIDFCFNYRSSDGSHEQVSSSTEYITSNDDGFNSRDNSDNVMQQLEQPYSDAVEKMRRKLEQSRDKIQLIKIAMDCMQAEIDKITNDNNDYLKKLFEKHNSDISDMKKKQWCYNCEQDAIYHCCWNTAYCSPTCQQQHWQAEHKKVCRRKR